MQVQADELYRFKSVHCETIIVRGTSFAGDELTK